MATIRLKRRGSSASGGGSAAAAAGLRVRRVKRRSVRTEDLDVDVKATTARETDSTQVFAKRSDTTRSKLTGPSGSSGSADAAGRKPGTKQRMRVKLR